jgi:hypothetical protein
MAEIYYYLGHRAQWNRPSVESSTDLFGLKITEEFCKGCEAEGEVEQSRGDRGRGKVSYCDDWSVRAVEKGDRPLCQLSDLFED